jgi:hypothetical protein
MNVEPDTTTFLWASTFNFRKRLIVLRGIKILNCFWIELLWKASLRIGVEEGLELHEHKIRKKRRPTNKKFLLSWNLWIPWDI